VKSELRRRDFNRLAVGLSVMGLSGLAQSKDQPRTIVVVGDSLSAEYGIARGTGWVALLSQQLANHKPPWQVVNASVSGDTTAGGLARLPALLKQHTPNVVVIELGGNDALRGFPLKTTENNLTQMIEASQKAKASVLLIGMQVPPNYGQAYAQDFSRMFARISQQQRTQLVPFMLKGVADATDPTALFQPDRIHPKAEAHPIILRNVWPVLKRML
jgi:acyl-CoA thioesterase-1